MTGNWEDKTVREFLDLIDDSEAKEEIRTGLLELLKSQGYSEEDIFEMKYGAAHDKLVEMGKQALFLLRK